MFCICLESHHSCCYYSLFTTQIYKNTAADDRNRMGSECLIEGENNPFEVEWSLLALYLKTYVVKLKLTNLLFTKIFPVSFYKALPASFYFSAERSSLSSVKQFSNNN